MITVVLSQRLTVLTVEEDKLDQNSNCKLWILKTKFVLSLSGWTTVGVTAVVTKQGDT